MQSRPSVVADDLRWTLDVSDVLIRDVPDDVLAAIDARAAKLGISRVLYVDKDFDLVAAVTGQLVERLELAARSRRR